MKSYINFLNFFKVGWVNYVALINQYLEPKNLP